MHWAQAAALQSDLLALAAAGAAGAIGGYCAQRSEELSHRCDASRTKARLEEDGAHGGPGHLESVLQSSPALRSAVEYKDVWCALPDALRAKICVETRKDPLAEKGYT